MSILVYLIPVALLLGGIGLAAFLWSLRNGQYDDLDGAAMRILLDDPEDDETRRSGRSGHDRR
jgi:cbb3-type cytochrome oxidase maturation protein